jgi:hypothetical protein
MLRKSLSFFAIVCYAIFTAARPTGAQPPQVLWTHTYGGSGTEYCNEVQPTRDGGFIFAGQNGSQGGIYPWLVKTDIFGNIEWSNVYTDAASNTYFNSVQQTSDGGYIAGGITRAYWDLSRIDYYLVRTDSLGNLLWSRHYSYPGLTFDYGKSVRSTFDGGFIFGGDTAPGPSPYEFYLIRTDAAGDTLWTRTYGDGGAGNERANSVIQTSDSNFVMAGYTDSYGAGSWDFYIVKINGVGDTLWTKTYGGSAGEEAFSLQETSDQGLIIAGYTSSFGAGVQDFYLVRTDHVGEVLWQRTYGGYENDYAKSVKQTPDGGFIIVGSTASFGAGFTDFYVVRIDGEGNLQWTNTYGGLGDERAYSVGLTSDGGFIVGGHTTSYGAGGYDVWMVRLAGLALGQVAINLDPVNPPLDIPPQGGVFSFNVTLTNDSTTYQAYNIWCSAQLPNGRQFTTLGPFNLVFTPGFNITRLRSQTVPAGAPAGDYIYRGCIGYSPETVLASDSFDFVKEDLVSGGPGSNAWECAGDPFPGEEPKSEAYTTSAEFTLQPCYPNPLNHTTTISYELRAASHVSLKIYDTAGRLMTTLADGQREAGTHHATFDGSNLASGIYLAKLQAREFTAVQKLVLLK